MTKIVLVLLISGVVYSVCMSLYLVVSNILYSLLDFVYLSVGNVSVWLPYVMIGASVVEIPIFILLAVKSYVGYSNR